MSLTFSILKKLIGQRVHPASIPSLTHRTLLYITNKVHRQALHSNAQTGVIHRSITLREAECSSQGSIFRLLLPSSHAHFLLADFSGTRQAILPEPRRSSAG